MWKPEHRAAADRRGLRYESDLTDAEWTLVAPLIRPAKRGGRPRTVNVREVLNGIFYVSGRGARGAAEGPAAAQHGLGVPGPVGLGRDAGAHPSRSLRRGPRKGGREASPTAAIIDSQSVKGAEKRGSRVDPSGFDAGKKINGRKRHILVDTLGLLLAVKVHPASVQDRDGAEPLLREARRSFPFVERIFADAGYQGRKTEAAVARTGLWELEIVRRGDRDRFVSCRSAGSSSARSLGSAAAAGSPGITSATPEKPRPSSASP